MRISENFDSPLNAREVQLLCPHCSTRVIVPLPYQPTNEVRQQRIKIAIDEHRRVCTGADATEGRVYEISYPRR